MVLRRTRFELRKAEERAELLEGYIVALSNLDEFAKAPELPALGEDDAARIEALIESGFIPAPAPEPEADPAADDAAVTAAV